RGAISHIVADEASTPSRAKQSPVRLSAIRGVAPYVLAVLICCSILVPLYKLWRVDLSIPLYDKGDALFYDALFKNFIESGDYNVNRHFAAPGNGELYDFPVPHSTHLIGLSFFRLFTRNWAWAINLYYLATYQLIAIVSLYVFRRFVIPTALALAGSVLFAFLPYHLLRSQYHFTFSSYFLVPLIVMAALWISGGNPLFRFKGNRQRSPVTSDGMI